MDILLHIDKYLYFIVQEYGTISYLIVPLIIFIETGFVFVPFLPGDSLLFAVGAIVATGSLNIFLFFIILSFAAIAGDTFNYWIGKFIGEKIITKNIIKRSHLEKTKRFFDKYGTKTIFIARFVPVVRTVAPFVAGIGRMPYRKFLTFNVLGGLAWVALFLSAGYFLGNLEIIKKNFSITILIIILLSIIPGIVEYIKTKRKKSVL